MFKDLIICLQAIKEIHDTLRRRDLLSQKENYKLNSLQGFEKEFLGAVNKGD